MSKKTLALLVVALVVARALLVLSCADVFFYGEELGKGTAAKAILDGLPVPHYQLNYVYHEGGGFVVTHLKAIAFLLVGESLLAHKLVAITTSAILLVVGCVFTFEAFGARAAKLFGALFVLAPDAYLRFSLLSLGTHFEALIFAALVLRYAYRIVRAENGASLDWAKLGLASGFGLYFSLQTAPAIACAGLYLVFGLRRRILSKGLAVAAITAFIGATPLLVMLRLVGMEAIRVRGQDLIGATGTGPWQSLVELLTPLGIGWAWLALYAVVIGVAIVTVHEREFRRQAFGIVAYMALFLALYCFSGLAVGMDGHWFLYLRTSALWFFGTVLFAACLARLMERDGWPAQLAMRAWQSAVVLGFAALVIVACTGRPLHPIENARIVASTKGVSYSEYFNSFLKHVDGDEAAKIRLLMCFHDTSDLLPSSIAQSVFEHSDVSLERALEISSANFLFDIPESMLGLGHRLHPNQGYDIPAAFARLETLSNTVPEGTRATLAEAIGRTGLGPRFRPERIAEQLAIAVPPKYREPFVWGAGWRVYFAFRLDPDAAHKFIAAQPIEDRAALTVGYESALVSNSL